MRSISWAVAAVALGSLAWSQDRTPVPVPVPSPQPTAGPELPASVLAKRPASPVGPAALAAAAAAVQLRPNIDAGSRPAFRADLDDSIPLPVPARVRATPDGDQLVEPASGNPFFLGFAGGSYFPPENELIDPLLLQSVQSSYDDGRPAQETYAFVMFQKRITPERIAGLESLGVRVLGFHPHYCLKVALSPSVIDLLAADPAVRWIGMARPQQKLHPRLGEELAKTRAGIPLDVYIDVFDSDLGPDATATPVGSVSLVDNGVEREAPPGADALPQVVLSGGWQERGLRQNGVEVLEYVDSVRAFRARIAPQALSLLAGLDYVQFIEPNLATQPHHDESTPLIMSDYTRIYNTGGTTAAVTGGIIDSGVKSGHVDFWHMNGVGWDFSGSAGGAWTDGCTHGSHVAGTILGDGSGTDDNRGNAPGLGNFGFTRFFNAKIFRDDCSDPAPSYASVLSVMHNAFWDGVSLTQRPMVINNSYGINAGASAWKGTETNPRLLDNEVYYNFQNYVFSAGNQGAAGTIGQHATSKNVLTVGNVYDYRNFGVVPGQLAWDSSMGPVGDGRWKPNVCAPGNVIHSVDANTTSGYSFKSGTSMAAPHVTGTIAQLLDQHAWLRYAPARVDSIAMAAAVTRNNQVLTSPGEAHLNQYGTGRIDAYKMLYGSSQLGWTNWGFSLSSNTYTYADFTVPSGCTRVVACMNYKEAAASSGATKSLVSNWDFFLDQAPIDPNFNTGDWYAQQSTVDNTEIRILDYPQVGAWRWKIWPTSTSASADFGVTLYFFTGTTTPDLTVQVVADKTYVRPYEDVNITGWVYNPATLASAVFLESGTTADAYISSSRRSLYDVPSAEFTDNQSGGKYVTMGDMLDGVWKGNIWTTNWSGEGTKFFGVYAGSDNAVNHSVQTNIVVDGTAPSTPTGFTSDTHTAFQWSNNPNVHMVWNPSTDNLSGVAGYSVANYFGAPGWPDTYVDTTGTDYWFPLPSSGQDQYLTVLAIDNSGNYSVFAADGPYRIDTDAPSDPTSVVSTSHSVNVPTCTATISMQWNASSDGESGVFGYTTLFDHAPDTEVAGNPLNIIGAGNTFWNEFVGPSESPFYFHIAAQDVAGNWSATVHAGPYYTSIPSFTYCVAKTNSLGCTPYIDSSGVASASSTSGFTVYGYNVRNNKSGILFYGTTGQNSAPFQGGTLCVAAPIKRTPSVNSGGSPNPANDCTGMYQIDMNAFAHGVLGGNPIAGLKVVGTTVNCQWWGRDPGFAAPNNTTLTDGLQYVVCY
jgi:subtilase family protein